MGSKNRIFNNMMPIILKDRKINQYYIEPFVGGCNSIDKVDGLRIGSDKNKYIFEMWKGLQENKERPCTIDKKLYDEARTEFNNGTNNKFDDFTIGWIGWMASYNGRFFDGGYAGNYLKRDYIDEQIRNTESQIDNIKDIIFHNKSYEELDIPNNSIIYCDIPYKGTKQYIASKNFNYDNFWEWCRNKTTEGHSVFISEYNAPLDFECVWEKQVTNSMNTSITYKPIEKLFVYKNSIDDFWNS